MYKAWSTSASDGVVLARAVEAYLNEYAAEVLTVSYAIDQRHHVMVVYRPLDPEIYAREETAVAVAEQIIDGSQL